MLEGKLTPQNKYTESERYRMYTSKYYQNMHAHEYIKLVRNPLESFLGRYVDYIPVLVSTYLSGNDVG